MPTTTHTTGFDAEAALSRCVAYVDSDVPAGMTLDEYRRARPRATQNAGLLRRTSRAMRRAADRCLGDYVPVFVPTRGIA